jgi:hypothetical protein
MLIKFGKIYVMVVKLPLLKMMQLIIETLRYIDVRFLC